MATALEITVFRDRSFTFITKTPPSSALILKAAGVEKGSGLAPAEKVGYVTWQQVRAIAEKKKADLNAYDIEAAMQMIAGSARSMGIRVGDELEVKAWKEEALEQEPGEGND